MRKLSLFCLACSVALLGLTGVLYGQTVSFPDTTAAPGSTILIPLYTTEVSPDSNVQSFDVSITYDPAIADYVDIDTTGILIPSNWFTIFYSPAPGTLNGGSFMTSTPYLSGAGVLVYIQFDIPDTAQGMTDLTFQSFYYNQTLITTVDGSITIEVGLANVSGYAYLENQTNHAGIQVFFEAVTGGQSATTYTNFSGFYSLDVVPGTYNIHYSRPGFETVTVSDVEIIGTTVLDDVTLPQILTAIINGSAFLEGQTIHAGIQVLFLAAGPGSVTDTAWTDNNGDFSIEIIQGMYDVHYSYDGYEPYELLDQNFTASQTLPDVTLIEIPTAVTITIPDTTIYENNVDIVLPLFITYVSPCHIVESYDFRLEFDSTLIEANTPVYEITGTITPQSWTNSYNTLTPGIISGGASALIPGDVMSGEGVLVFLNLHIPDGASGTTPLDFIYFNFSENAIVTPTAVDGELTVEVSGVERIPDGGIPSTFSLEQNYPNPFNPTTTIEFALPHQSMVHLAVYNLLGEEVAVLANHTLEAGSYSVVFDANHLPSGFYFYRLVADEFTQTKKCLLVE